MKIKRALLSVSDKTGVVEFARRLHELGVEIVSTGGTMQALRAAGIPVTYVSDITNFPEIMDGRVKTLHPYIHGGILAVRGNDEHVAAMKAHGIVGIDLVVVNLYPFRQTVAKPDVTLGEAIENIDIGGPAMIRAAAKNFQDVTVIVDPERYDAVLTQLTAEGAVGVSLRMALAQEAFAHTAEYDAHISSYLNGQQHGTAFAPVMQLTLEQVQSLRYGENPHQQAAFYREKHFSGPGIANARQLHGKALSFNNIVDAEAAYAVAAEFERPAATIIKHTNPCGSGVGATLAEAYGRAYTADPVSAFGGIVAVNRVVDEATAAQIADVFIEAVIAPGFDQAALAILTKKPNIRLLVVEFADGGRRAGLDYKKVSGGLLVQNLDTADTNLAQCRVVTKRQPTADELEQLAFAWKIVKHVKSNAIVVAGDHQTYGIGAGQTNRVGAAAIALAQAGKKAQGAVLASDAFFPFRDTIDAAAEAGIVAIVQPGGSVRDDESIQAADAHGITMIFTGVRHFKH